MAERRGHEVVTEQMSVCAQQGLWDVSKVTFWGDTPDTSTASHADVTGPNQHFTSGLLLLQIQTSGLINDRGREEMRGMKTGSFLQNT